MVRGAIPELAWLYRVWIDPGDIPQTVNIWVGYMSIFCDLTHYWVRLALSTSGLGLG